MAIQGSCTQTTFTRVKAQDRRFIRFKEKRLEIIKANHSLPPFDLIRLVVDSDLVSDYYTEDHLQVDLWYVSRVHERTNRKMYASGKVVSDPLAYLFLYVVIQALLDVEKGRPCDLHLWHCDLSPDGKNCTPTYHICRAYAEDYLCHLPCDVEKYIGLDPGTIKTYTKDLCKC